MKLVTHPHKVWTFFKLINYINIKDIVDNYLLRTDYHQSSEQDPSESSAQLHLKLLKRVREVKDFEEAEGYVPFTHVGFKV